MGPESESDAVALGDAGERDIGGGADESAVATDAAAELERQPQRRRPSTARDR